MRPAENGEVIDLSCELAESLVQLSEACEPWASG